MWTSSISLLWCAQELKRCVKGAWQYLGLDCRLESEKSLQIPIPTPTLQDLDLDNLHQL